MSDPDKRNAARAGGGVSGIVDVQTTRTAGHYSHEPAGAIPAISLVLPGPDFYRERGRWQTTLRRRGDLSAAERVLGAEIADQIHSRKGFAWAKQETLAAALGFQVRWVKVLSKRLVAAGLITVRRSGKGLEYRLLIQPESGTSDVHDHASLEGPPDREEGHDHAPQETRQVHDRAGTGAQSCPSIETNEETHESALSESRARGGDLFGQVKPRSARRKPNIPLPEDWRPDDSHFVLGQQLGLTAARVLQEADAMRDWCASKGATSRDWDARFRNWLRKAPAMSRASTPTRADARDVIHEIRAEQARMMEAAEWPKH